MTPQVLHLFSPFVKKLMSSTVFSIASRELLGELSGPMGIRQFILLAGTTFAITTSAMVGQSAIAVNTEAETLISQRYSEGRGSFIELADRVPPWLMALGVAGGAFVGFTWLHLYQDQRRWQRVELARQEAKLFREREAVKQVLDILDYEEYRVFYINHPEDGHQIAFEANDYRLRRALRSHDQMVKTRQGLDEIKKLAKTHPVSPQTMAVVEKYENEEFVIEITLRDWFDSFLGGLEYFEILMESGLMGPDEIKPFIIYWIKLIGDRTYRRKGGSGFYDQLFHYIHWAGYSRVQKLFERYGYKILPPPYSAHDFSDFSTDPHHDTYRAICLAKAAYLVYEDREYVNDIVNKWVNEATDHAWMKLTPREYVVDLMKQWLQEGKETSDQKIRENFRYLDLSLTDTQAFLLRQGRDIILVFRGSQQLQDWQTNFKIRLQEFTVLADQKAVPPQGRVHRGFLEAWQSVEKMVVYYLKKWWTPQSQLWITGHSLGGALANMAAISLESQGFHVNGLYTFGQPRIADWKMVGHINRQMGDRIFRYANNNDIVPLIPPTIAPILPPRVYGHMGNFRYFDFRGQLQKRSFLLQRFPDRLLGFLVALWRSGFDAVDDHKMEFYLANLQKALEYEQEQAKLETERRFIKGEFMEQIQDRFQDRLKGQKRESDSEGS